MFLSQLDTAADILSRTLGALCEALLTDGVTCAQPWLGSQLVNLLQLTSLISRALKERGFFLVQEIYMSLSFQYMAST